jgi:WD40 repeat protein
MRRAHFVDPDEPEQWTRFVRTLESPCQAPRVPFMAENLPEDFVARPAELEALVAALLDETREEAVAITTALEGAGGFGKTALARALCHDERVQDAFYDGILWVTLGEAPGEATGRVADLIEILTGARPGFDTVEAATAKLAEVLAERTMLIVVDDVWNARDLRPFLRGGRRCARLITTRDRSTVPADARQVLVDAMRPAEALALLGHGLPAEEIPALATLTDRLGEWPLLLKLVNGMVRERVSRSRQPLADALAYVERALERRGLSAFDARDAGDRGQAVAGTLGVSLGMLTDDQRTRFAELAVFPEDVDVPLAAVETLWAATGGLDDLDTEDLCQTLFRLSLLLTLDLATRRIRLHDVVRAYLLPTDAEARAALHRRLLDAYRIRCPEGWASGPNDGYFFQHLSYHLVEAGEQEELRRLLLDYAWIAAKLDATDIGSLIVDYVRVTDDELPRLVKQALGLSAHVLTEDKTQLSSQLVGRLRGVELPEVREFVRGAGYGPRGTWLRPERPSLTQAGGPQLRTLIDYTGVVAAVAVLADTRHAVSGSYNGRVRLWDLETGECLRTAKGCGVTAVAVLVEGCAALSGSRDDILRLWELQTGECFRTLHEPTWEVSAVAVLPDGRRALSGSGDGTLRLWDLRTGETLRILTGHLDKVSAVAALPDGRRGLSGSWDSTLRLWNLETGEFSRLEGHANIVTVVAVTANGRCALSGSQDNTLRLWDLETGKSLRTLEGHTDGVSAVAVLADGHRALSGSDDGTLRLWDLETGESLRILEGHTGSVTTVVAQADWRRAFSGSVDGTLRLWDLETRETLRTLERHEGSVTTVAAQADCHRAFSGSDDGTLRLWDLETGQCLRTLEGHTDLVSAVAVLADGRRAVSGSFDNTLRLWDLETGECLRTLEARGSFVMAMAVLTVGRRALSIDIDRLRLWDLETGQCLRTLEGHTEGVSAVEVLADGSRAVSGSYDNTLRLWDLETGQCLRTLEGQTGGVSAVVVLADGSRAVSGSYDNTLRLWDLETGDCLRTLEARGSFVMAMAVLTDGRRALSVDIDRLRLWDLETGESLRTLEVHTDWARAVKVLADGRRALFGSGYDTLWLWDLESGEGIASFTGDAAITCVAVARDDLFVAGSGNGALHILRLIEPGD